MPQLRRYPPVHAPLRLRGLYSAVQALQAQGARDAQARALEALRHRYPAHRALLTDSGTSALRLALETTAPKGSRERIVALPAYACPDLGSAAVGAGYRMRLYDVNPRTLQPDWPSLERVFAQGVTHVVGAHLYGRLVDMARISELAAAHGAVVIEDAAQHAGGTLRGVRGGALASVSMLSFGRGKGINAGGGGALLITDDAQTAIPSLTRHHAQRSFKIVLTSAAVGALSHPLLYWLPQLLPGLGLGETVYHAPRTAEEMPAASAALLIDALQSELEHLRERQRVEQWYGERLQGYRDRLFEPLADSLSGALRFPVRLLPAEAESLGALGVARSYPRTLAAYPEIAARTIGTEAVPGAEQLAREVHTLPTHSLLSDAVRERVVEGLEARFGGGYRK